MRKSILSLGKTSTKEVTQEGYTKMDLTSNLKEIKRRLGMFDKTTIEVKYTNPYAESNHDKAVAYFGKEKVQLMSNSK